MRARAERDGKVITVVGQVVYEHVPGQAPTAGKSVGWFMALTNYCVC
jgi:hypothetical protein